MAALKKIKHILTIGSDKYSFYSADIYGSWGSAFGVSKAPANDNTVYKGKLNRDSFSDGKAIRVKARGSADNQKSRDFTFIVSFEKAREALANIGSKTVSVNSITYNLGEARIPGRRRFS
jgi:hypothetical protein